MQFKVELEVISIETYDFKNKKGETVHAKKGVFLDDSDKVLELSILNELVVDKFNRGDKMKCVLEATPVYGFSNQYKFRIVALL